MILSVSDFSGGDVDKNSGEMGGCQSQWSDINIKAEKWRADYGGKDIDGGIGGGGGRRVSKSKSSVVVY